MRDDLVASNVAGWERCAGTLRSSFPLEGLGIADTIPRSARILDVGCGDGRVLRWLHDAGYRRLRGVDPSRTMSRLAALACSAAEVYWLQDPRESLASGSRFDVALLIGVLSSVPSVEARRDLVRRAADVLSPGGEVLIADFCVTRTADYQGRYASGGPEPFTFRSEEGLWIHHFEEGEIEELLGDAFEIQRKRALPVLSSHGRPLMGAVVSARLRVGS